MFKIKKTCLKTKDKLVVYDTDSHSPEFVLAGPDISAEEISVSRLPEGFRWVNNNEIEVFPSI